MKHKHADMIKAKAENMDLVVFIRANCNAGWVELEVDEFPVVEDFEYFLCLPQHNEKGQCLHWLNGGEVQVCHLGVWVNRNHYNGWCNNHVFMDCKAKSRIQPKKGKRWIVAKKSALSSMMYFHSEEDANKATMSCGEFHGGQVIEIEVEA